MAITAPMIPTVPSPMVSMVRRGPNAGALRMATPSRTIPIGTSSTPVASMVSNTLWAPCQAYSIAGRSSGGVSGAVYRSASGDVETCSMDEAAMMTRPNSATAVPKRAAAGWAVLSNRCRTRHVKGEQHQRTEIEEVLGDATRLDVGEVPEGLDVGRIRQPQGDPRPQPNRARGPRRPDRLLPPHRVSWRSGVSSVPDDGRCRFELACIAATLSRDEVDMCLPPWGHGDRYRIPGRESPTGPDPEDPHPCCSVQFHSHRDQRHEPPRGSGAAIAPGGAWCRGSPPRTGQAGWASSKRRRAACTSGRCCSVKSHIAANGLVTVLGDPAQGRQMPDESGP